MLDFRLERPILKNLRVLWARTPVWPVYVIVASLAVRVFLIFRYRFDRDESQHMHVAWGWAHGLMQYRDVFDNHMPLFHMLWAPLFLFGGDDPRLLFVARLSMLPLFGATLFLVWQIARQLFDLEVAWWSAALVAVYPSFFLCSLEYRTDDLWVVAWLAVIALLLSRLPQPRKFIWAGLFLGIAVAVSMKSVMFLMVLFGAAVITALLTRWRPSFRPRDVAAGLAMAVFIPALIAAGFALSGAWTSFVYGVVGHNRFPIERAWRGLLVVPLYLIVRYIVLRLRSSPRVLFVFLCCALYLTILVSFWPLAAAESYLPFYPLAILLAAPLLMRLRPAAPAVCAIGLIATIAMARPWKNEAQKEIDLVRQVLRMTMPYEPVMDSTYETVFRPRPYYFAIEAITNMKLRLGIIHDRIAEALVATATHVVISERLPPAARRFVAKNYLSWGAVHVSGARVPPDANEFTIAIPGRYVVLGGQRVVAARIDNVPSGRGVYLTPGRHTLQRINGDTELLVIWVGALRWRPV